MSETPSFANTVRSLTPYEQDKQQPRSWRHKLADRLHRLAYGMSWEQHAESIRREWLEKGIERGQAKPRQGTIFDLYLARADESEPARVAMQRQGGIQAASGGGDASARWYWWIVVGDGREASLGPVELTPAPVALQRYLELLPEDVLKLVGQGGGK